MKIQSFYANNNGIPFLEKALRNEIKEKNEKNELHLELTSVGLPCSPSDLNTLQVAMYCFVHALWKVHQNDWSIIDLRWPNTIEFNGCYYIIDAGEFATQHGHKIHSEILKKFDERSVMSCPASDIYMLKEMMKNLDVVWRYNPHAISFMKELEKCYQNNSLESALGHKFLIKPADVI